MCLLCLQATDFVIKIIPEHIPNAISEEGMMSKPGHEQEASQVSEPRVRDHGCG